MHRRGNRNVGSIRKLWVSHHRASLAAPTALDPEHRTSRAQTRRSASAGNRTRVTSMATVCSTTRPLMHLVSCWQACYTQFGRPDCCCACMPRPCWNRHDPSQPLRKHGNQTPRGKQFCVWQKKRRGGGEGGAVELRALGHRMVTTQPALNIYHGMLATQSIPELCVRIVATQSARRE